MKDEKERKEKILFCSVPTRREIENCKKIAKKLKDKKYHYGFIPRQNRLVKDEKERKEKLTLRFVPTRRVIENSKNIAKKFKKLKCTIMASFQAKIGGKRPRKREYKKYRSV